MELDSSKINEGTRELALPLELTDEGEVTVADLLDPTPPPPIDGEVTVVEMGG